MNENDRLISWRRFDIGDHVDEMHDMFPLFCNYYEKAKRLERLGYYDIVGIFLRVALEYLLSEYFVNYRGYSRSEIKEFCLYDLVCDGLRCLFGGSYVDKSAHSLRLAGNCFAHYGHEVRQKDVRRMWKCLNLVCACVYDNALHDEAMDCTSKALQDTMVLMLDCVKALFEQSSVMLEKCVDDMRAMFLNEDMDEDMYRA